ncbi:MAG: hydroxyethylthiazole kinase [Firmicutes bacterium]|nr:hydroxyethylthiazole kinase [Bacillota bacterium]
MNEFVEKLKTNLKKIRLESPIIHHITNAVTINDCANVTASLKASPVMAYFEKEVAEITSASNALVLNFGTPDETRFKSATISGIAANKKGIPIVIDPVGVGASKFRHKSTKEMLCLVKPSIIKGNTAEIKALAGIDNKNNRCIDSSETEIDIETLKDFSLRLNAVIAVTGKRDLITDGSRTAFIERGTPMFTHISGAGCMASSVIGTFSAVEKDFFEAAVQSLYAVNICGERAAAVSNGPADFKMNFINFLYCLEKSEIEKEGVFFE